MTTGVKKAKLTYQQGFGNHFLSEAIEGALPQGQNSPQKPPYGLYAEQISGSAFTALRHESLRTWTYRIRPSVLHSPFQQIDPGLLRSRPFSEVEASPNQMRWEPLPYPDNKVDFIGALTTLAGNGSYGTFRGSAAHVYRLNAAMGSRYFFNCEGEMLIVPQEGDIFIKTELGNLEVKPGEICVIPKGIKYQVDPEGERARGYVCENYGIPFRLPYLGPIGANGLANSRDFLAPQATYENAQGSFKLVCKFQGSLWEADIDHSPFDVVAWHGNYVPYKYDLGRFQAINTVTFDHCDPSIFTVLTSPSELVGVANVDFVIFPPRWSVAERTFRPPYYHRNVMSEFMGLIHGIYEAKQEGFRPGGASLHNCLSAHGPDADTFKQASQQDLRPTFMGETLAFMFESSLVFSPTRFACESTLLQKDYLSCWSGLKAHFKQG